MHRNGVLHSLYFLLETNSFSLSLKILTILSPMTKDSTGFLAALPPLLGCAAAFLGTYYLWNRKQRLKLFVGADVESLLFNEETEDTATTECIYLDYNGTTPIHPLVLATMLPFFTMHFGNPSSSHYFGQQPKLAVDGARRSLLALLGEPTADPASIWYTGCGTESDNLAIQLALQSNPSVEQKHIVTSNVEHPAIDVCLQALTQEGLIEVTRVPVGPDGRVAAHDMIAAIRPNTILVTLMLANNESGALQPVKEVSEACRKRNILFHTDAAQAAGKISVCLADMGHPDMVTLVGHKIGAPKGVAALYVRPECCNEHGRSLADNKCILLLGGGQEHGRRGGTENVPYIVGLGKAAELALANLERNAKHMEEMRARLLRNLKAHLCEDHVRPNGPLDPSMRLPNTLSVGIQGIQSGDLLRKIGMEVAASAGAACHSSGSGGGISAVLKAMNVPDDFARGTLRLSIGPTTTAAEIDTASVIISQEAKRQVQQAKHNLSS
jgi:cysteine desulfurase